MRDWRKSRLAAALVIAAFLTIQLAVPVSRLSSGDPARFGWQMYSSADPSPEFIVQTVDESFEIDIDDYLAARRVEVRIQDFLPVHLCSVVDGALVVTWEDGEHPC